VSDIDVKIGDRFTGFCAWYGKGHELPLMGCNGKKVCVPDGKTFAVDKKGTYFQFGSIVVQPGCTFTGYKNNEFTGPKYEITGPALISKTDFHQGHTVGDVYGALVGSFAVSCKQKLPDCQPTDSWQVIGAFDNSQSTNEAEFSYAHTVGTEWSAEVQQHFSYSAAITAELKASFFKTFESTIGSSITTGYDWSKTSSQAKSESTTTTVTIKVPAGERLQLERAVGKCGGSEVHTELMRAISSKTFVQNIHYWTEDDLENMD